MSEIDEYPSSSQSVIDSARSQPHVAVPGGSRQILLLVGGCLLVAMTLLLVPIPLKHRGFGALGDLCHAPLFALLTFGIVSLLDQRIPIAGWAARFWWRLAIVAVGACLFGLAVEVLQSYSGRKPAWHDVRSNSLGILAAVSWHVRSRLRSHACNGGHRRTRAGLASVASILLIAAWYRPLMVLTDVAMVHIRFPMISSFETSMQKDCWFFRNAHSTLSQKHVVDGRSSLEMTVQPKPLTGCTCFEMHGNWSAMQALMLDIRLDDEHPHPTAVLTIQIVDDRHEDPDAGHFEKSVVLDRGQWKTIALSRSEIINFNLENQLDLARIRFLDLFFLSPPLETKVFIDNVRIVAK